MLPAREVEGITASLQAPGSAPAVHVSRGGIDGRG